MDYYLHLCFAKSFAKNATFLRYSRPTRNLNLLNLIYKAHLPLCYHPHFDPNQPPHIYSPKLFPQPSAPNQKPPLIFSLPPYLPIYHPPLASIFTSPHINICPSPTSTFAPSPTSTFAPQSSDPLLIPPPPHPRSHTTLHHPLLLYTYP